MGTERFSNDIIDEVRKWRSIAIDWRRNGFGRGGWGPSIKYVTLFLANFYPPIMISFFNPSPCHTLSHMPGPPESTSHISDPPGFLVGLVQKSRTKVPCTNSISIVRGGFVRGVLSGLVFVRSPFFQNTSVTPES